MRQSQAAFASPMHLISKQMSSAQAPNDDTSTSLVRMTSPVQNPDFKNSTPQLRQTAEQLPNFLNEFNGIANSCQSDDDDDQSEESSATGRQFDDESLFQKLMQ